MDYNYLIETKNEFLNTIVSILTPQIYNGLLMMYDHSVDVFTQLKKKIENNPKNISQNIVNYFKLKTNDFSKMTVEEVENEYYKIKIDIFKKYVNDIASKNNMEIEGEYIRIKNESKFSEIFDSLLFACFKSYLLFFTFDPKTKTSKFNSSKYYENINIRDFIHKCYVETCTFFQNNPELFIKRNKKTEINEHIKTCIIMSIRKSLPYNDLIQEYLRIEYDMKQNKLDEFKKMEQLINNIMDKNKSKYIINEKENDQENEKEINEDNNYTKHNDDKKLKINKIINDNKNKKIILSENESTKSENIKVNNIFNKEKINKIKNNILEEETSLDNYETNIDNYETNIDSKNKLNTKENNKEDNKENNINDSVVKINEKIDVKDTTLDDNDTMSSGEESDMENSSNTSEDENSNITSEDENSNMSGGDENKKSPSIITSLASIPKRTARISKIKNTIDKNMEKFYNDLII